MLNLTPDEIRNWINGIVPNIKWGIGGNPYQGLGNSPYREDKHPSFSFNAEKGVWNDFTTGEGGSIKSFCQKMGIPTPWDGKVNNRGNGRNAGNGGTHKKISKDTQTLYDYKDETGTILFQSVRIDKTTGKTFFQRRPDGNGGWINALNGTRIVPYRYPEMIKALESGVKQLFIPEGEKCVDLLRSLGLNAICNPCGSKWKWEKLNDEFYRHISTDTEIIVLADADKPGQGHADDVIRNFNKRGYSKLKTITLHTAITEKDGKDVYDWIKDEEHTKTELLKLVAKSPTYQQNQMDKITPRCTMSENIWDQHISEPNWIIPGMITEGLTILAGKPKIGKSWLAMQIAIAKTSGGQIFGKKIEQGGVLYLALEDTERRIQHRLKHLSPEIVYGIRFATDWTNGQEGISHLDLFLTAYPDVKLVIIDTLQRFRPPQTNGNQYRDDYKDVAEIKKVADEHGVSIILVHHLRKGESIDPVEGISGTFGISGAADTLLVLQKDRGQMDASMFVTGRDVEEQQLALKWDKEQFAGWTLLGEAETYRQTTLRIKILKLLEENKYLTPKELSELLSDPNKPNDTYRLYNTIKHTLPGLLSQGLIKKIDKGRYSLCKSPKNNTLNTIDKSDTFNTLNTLDTLSESDGNHSVSSLSVYSGNNSDTLRKRALSFENNDPVYPVYGVQPITGQTYLPPTPWLNKECPIQIPFTTSQNGYNRRIEGCFDGGSELRDKKRNYPG